MSEYEYWIWFASIDILPIKKNRLLEKFIVVKNIYNATQSEILEIDEINLLDYAEIENSKNLELIKKYVKYIDNNKITVININDKYYPKKLKEIYDPPIVLFAKGNLELLNKKSIALVGSRDASNYGLQMAYKFAYELAKKHITIISGLARGVDAMAHSGALKANGDTIAVIGSGHDIIYPKENIGIYNQILEKGLILSEFIVGTKVKPQNFPMRNRIVSALSLGVLVAQAKEKSGAMITVDFALEQGKNVYAMPGNIDIEQNKGNNYLISEGAKVVTRVADILEDFI